MVGFDIDATIQSRSGPIRLPKFIDANSGKQIVSETYRSVRGN